MLDDLVRAIGPALRPVANPAPIHEARSNLMTACCKPGTIASELILSTGAGGIFCVESGFFDKIDGAGRIACPKQLVLEYDDELQECGHTCRLNLGINW
jgi:hypothetical protein